MAAIYAATDWEALNPYDQFGVKPAGLVTQIPGVERSAGSGMMTSIGKPWHTSNPLFWFGVLAAVTFGLAGAATSVRVGPFRAGVSAGKAT